MVADDRGERLGGLIVEHEAFIGPPVGTAEMGGELAVDCVAESDFGVSISGRNAAESAMFQPYRAQADASSEVTRRYVASRAVEIACSTVLIKVTMSWLVELNSLEPPTLNKRASGVLPFRDGWRLSV